MEGCDTMEVQALGKTWKLKQFHFHAISEHTVNWLHFPVEAHLVHGNKDGETMVIAALIVSGCRR